MLHQLQRELNRFTDELESLIEDRIELFRQEASELKMNAANASGETISSHSAFTRGKKDLGADLIALYKALGGGWEVAASKQ